ncbi:MAG TPA: hypothetical protein VIR16_01340 [Candidatus Limnocylindrales bacterium]
MADAGLWFVAGLAVGLVIGAVLGLAAARVRAGGSGRMPGMANGGGPVPNTLVGPSSPRPGAPQAASPETAADPPGVRRVRQQVKVTVGPTGLQIAVDGRLYAHLAEIPDPLVLDEARMALRVAAQSVASASHRSAIEQELRQAGG